MAHTWRLIQFVLCYECARVCVCVFDAIERSKLISLRKKIMPIAPVRPDSSAAAIAHNWRDKSIKVKFESDIYVTRLSLMTILSSFFLAACLW